MTRLAAYHPVAEAVDVGGRVISLVRPSAPDDLHGSLDDLHPPYWARLWPSSIALAAELVGRDLSDLSVLEVGCGLGLGAIAAALAGADVLATDVDRAAVAFARENGRRVLHRRIASAILDLRDDAAVARLGRRFDLVLAADVLYQPGLAGALAGALEHLVTAGGEALIVHPWAGQADELVAFLRWPSRRWDSGGVHLVALRRPVG